MKTIMIQGTTSNAGKSLLLMGLARVLYKDGIDVFPFKSQNMSREFFISKTGEKFSTAQALQGIAAGKEPNYKMNPILLIPKTDMGSEVIVLGESKGHMKALEYFKYKNQLKPIIQETFKNLKNEYEMILIEGAGSPAEINLRENDIVNMGMAEIADADVLLVADIDRGGVFASIYGTVKLLQKEEQARIKGLIINKFRGDIRLLKNGIKMIEELLEIPVIGVIPYKRLNIPDEDSIIDEEKSANKNFSREEFEKELEKLEKIIRENLDMDFIYNLMENKDA